MSTPPPEQPESPGGPFPGQGSAPGGPFPGQGAPAGPPHVPGETPGKATASLILGILSLLLCALLGPVAIIYGNQAKEEIDANPGLGGRGLAQAGVILGWIGVTLMVIGIIVAIVIVAAGS